MKSLVYNAADNKEVWSPACLTQAWDAPRRSLKAPSARLLSPPPAAQRDVVLDSLITCVSSKSFLTCTKLLVSEMFHCNESYV